MEKRIQKIEKNIQTLMQKGVCKHRWKNIETFATLRGLDKTQVKVTYVLQCRLCGDIKKVDIQ